ncbi:Uncharacterized protein YktB, UPF0637 family [Lentibacillus halodurans]|uniref:UPF0637 protein SAMN04488072_10911 n=1 Tax=Lentibacillus halodurans TaxID=237679 RepID=A0A1I0YZF0_9BACI|nr:DUF1054 domain-containing protein [Lentibacillus halodurans]SFB18226.1 Uncharacterized protein YktB, UPF0637 family [Lentibacillus halodurans]
MKFTGFAQSDFDTFTIGGLEERMEAIRGNIQPKFKAIGEELSQTISDMTGNDIYVHIAQHARRTKNPPNDTWMAFCHDKRGYKKHPHFQIGLFDDHLFIWLAYIYELPNKQEMAKSFLDHMDDIQQSIPDDYVISLDHTKKDATSLAEIDLEQALTRFQNVKKAEFLIGRHFSPNDPVLQDGQAFLKEAKDTFEKLTPLYKISIG